MDYEETTDNQLLNLLNKREKVFNELAVEHGINLIESCRDLLHFELKENKSLEFHEKLWQIVEKYFDCSQIVDMIKHADKYGNNLLQIAVIWNTREVLKLTMDRIDAVLSKNDGKGLMNYLKHYNDDAESILHILVKDQNEVRLRIFWNKLENYFYSQNSHNKFLSQKTVGKNENILHLAAKCDKIQFHETLWELLVNTFENREELKELIMQKNKFGDDVVHYLIIYNKPDITNFYFKKFKETFIDIQYQEILESKGEYERNLLQRAAVGAWVIMTHQFLWRIFRDFFKSDEKFLDFIQEVDQNGNNVFHLAACFSTAEIFEFMLRNLENVASANTVRNILSKSGYKGKSLLQSAALQNESFQFHQSLWKIFENYFESSQIVDMINHTDIHGDNVLLDVIECNTKEVVELTWTKIKMFIRGQESHLMSTGRDLLQISLRNRFNPDVREYCKVMMKEYELILEKPAIIATYYENRHLKDNEHSLSSLRKKHQRKFGKGPGKF